jgi:hypothetical protein
MHSLYYQESWLVILLMAVAEGRGGGGERECVWYELHCSILLLCHTFQVYLSRVPHSPNTVLYGEEVLQPLHSDRLQNCYRIHCAPNPTPIKVRSCARNSQQEELSRSLARSVCTTVHTFSSTASHFVCRALERCRPRIVYRSVEVVSHVSLVAVGPLGIP